jgi:hypothetical protein
LCAPTPEDAETGTLVAQPEWYALLLARSLIGDRPVLVNMQSPDTPDVDAAAFLAANGSLQLVVVDDDPPGARSLTVRMRVGDGFSGARILALTAPSPTAISGVELGGRAVAADGSWSEPPTLPDARAKHGVIAVTIRPSSAALLTVSPRS